MGRKIWTRAHEESTINLRPVFQPDSSGRTLSPIDSYQNIQPIGYGYARRPIYQNNELYQADAAAVSNQGLICNGRTYPNAAALFQEMEMQAINGGSGAKYNSVTIITAR